MDSHKIPAGLGLYLLAELKAELEAQKRSSEQLNQELSRRIDELKIEPPVADESEFSSLFLI
ncbi:MAG: hypothetical protein K2X27_13310 [Candidatus Obscuribacterales bacterium]|nr:hypothetical protein [Candidatus Obscuribacterales bacterium]